MHDDNNASSFRPPASEPGHADQADRRGSHATTYGQGFSWVLIWTILGGLIPGAGLVAAGWRRVGALVLFIVGLALAGLAAFALTGDVLKKSITLVTNPQKLLYLAAGAAVVGLIWGLIILFTHSQLRRYANLNAGQRAFSGLVVVSLLVAVAIPTYTIGSTAIQTRGVIAAVAGGDENDGTTSDPSNTTKADPWAGVDRMNVLLIGSDAGKGRTGTRPDTMIVASIDVKSGNTVLISLPRNLERAPFAAGTGGAKAWPNGFYCPADACLLNAVWQWGELNAKEYYPNSKNPGLRATEDAIEGVTGLKINTWASLNLDGFRQFVDAIGGVTVNVEERLPMGGNGDPTSPRYHKAFEYIEAGKNQHLDGFHALWFARSRWSQDDFHRIRRQRCVIGAVIEQAKPAKMVQQFSKIASAAKDNILTGISPSKFDAWVVLALRVKSAKVTSIPIDDTVVKDRTDPNYQQIRTLIKKALKESVAPAKATPTTAATSGPTTGSTPKPTSTKASTKTSNTPAAETPGKAQNIKDVC